MKKIIFASLFLSLCACSFTGNQTRSVASSDEYQAQAKSIRAPSSKSLVAKCWIHSQDYKNKNVIRHDEFSLNLEPEQETKIGDLYGERYFVQVSEGNFVTIMAKTNSSEHVYSSIGSRFSAEIGGLLDSCAGTGWYDGECMNNSKEIGAVGCTLVRNKDRTN